jgi:hypothetical protein
VHGEGVWSEIRYWESIAGLNTRPGSTAHGHVSQESSKHTPIPAKNFWSFTVYDNQTRPLLSTDQKLAGVDSTLPQVQKNPAGGATVLFGPKPPPGAEANWVQTMPGKGY